MPKRSPFRLRTWVRPLVVWYWIFLGSPRLFMWTAKAQNPLASGKGMSDLCTFPACNSTRHVSASLPSWIWLMSALDVLPSLLPLSVLPPTWVLCYTLSCMWADLLSQNLSIRPIQPTYWLGWKYRQDGMGWDGVCTRSNVFLSPNGADIFTHLPITVLV